MADEENKDNKWLRWNSELELSGKVKGFDTWQTRAKKIIRRYRDEREASTSDESTEGAKFNILWSNVQTLKPALFAKSPKPVVERRYLDRDPVGRVSSVVLERALSYEIEESNFASTMSKAVLDRLLPGRGVAWVRYEPKFSPMSSNTQEEPGDKVETPQNENVETTDDVEAPQEVSYECVRVDYIDWQDFRTGPARIWVEVPWVAKRVRLTKKEAEARFKDKADKLTYDWMPEGTKTVVEGASSGETDEFKKVEIWEIWDKVERKALWWAKSYPDGLLDEQDDPLKLENFFPVPEPLYATLTNDSLIPVPDYYEYQDQAQELDDLTNRIAQLTKAIKAAGCYDASVPELQRMLEEGFENKLVAVDDWSTFASKMGPQGMGGIWLMPIKELAEVLLQLYSAREQVKAALFEITGLSDIVRGQSQGPEKTATEQRIKGQFASMRLNDMQGDVNRFARDILRIMGEIISEHFDPMTLFLISGYEQYAAEQFPASVPSQMGHNGGPPLNPQAPGAVMPPAQAGAGLGVPLPPQAPQPAPMGPPPVTPQKQAAEMFQKAIALLKNDKLRGFRIDIEVDSMIEPDREAVQKSRTELLGALSQFLPQALEAGQAVPQIRPLMGQLLLFFLRAFRAGRDLESSFEQFIDDMQKEAANPQPPPPSPEQIKAQALQQQTQMDMQAAQAKGQLDMQVAQQKAQSDAQSQQLSAQTEGAKVQGQLQLMQAEMQNKQAELAIERERLAIKTQEVALEREFMLAKHAAEMEMLQARKTEAKAGPDA